MILLIKKGMIMIMIMIYTLFAIAILLIVGVVLIGVPYKTRRGLKPYSVNRFEVCDKSEADCYWLGEDYIVYYGRRWGVLIVSGFNDWAEHRQKNHRYGKQ
jgi:hypothetical protein